MKFKKTCIAAAMTLSAVGGVSASGHFIAGLQGQYPEYDLNDSYVFASSNKDHTTFIASFNPSVPGNPAAPTGQDFGQGGLYNLHIANDETLTSGTTWVVSFKGNAVTVSQLASPNAAVGEQGDTIATGTVGQSITTKDGVKVWTGRGQEPFFGNGVGLAKFNAAKQQGQFAPELFETDGDLFVGATASFVVLDVPNALLGENVKFYNSTAVNHKGEWVQVDRHAHVLFPYVLLSDTPAVHEDHGQHRPEEDVKERRQTIVHNAFWAQTVAGVDAITARQQANALADKVMPDLLSYRVGSQAKYGVDDLNGRALSDDAMNTILHLMMGVAVDDHANDGKRYDKQFPYIIKPQVTE